MNRSSQSKVKVATIQNKSTQTIRWITAGLILLSLLLFASSCTTSKIASDYDSNKDFTTYKTFSFLNWHPDNSKMIDEVERNRMYKVITEEMEARGYKKVTISGELAINIIVMIDKKKNYTAMYNMYRPSYYGYSYGYYSGGAYYSNYNYTYSPYSVKTVDNLYGGIVIDLYDVQEKEQIWQGSVTGKVSNDEKTRSYGGPKAIQAIYAKFPVAKTE